jgi:predicted permease
VSSSRDALWRRLRRNFWPVPIDAEIDEEFAAHLAMRIRQYVAEGLTEDQARARAEARFGDAARVRAECRGIRETMERRRERSDRVRNALADAAFALRALRHNALTAAVIVLTLALAIGASTTVFSVVDAVLLRPLPYRFADRVSLVWNDDALGASTRGQLSAAEYFDLQEQLRAYDGAAAMLRQPGTLSTPGGEPERVIGYAVTSNFFSLLGVEPVIGRSFAAGDAASGARVVVLSYALWQRRFGGDSSIIGRTIQVPGTPTVIGVMPPGVRFPDAPMEAMREPADYWVVEWEFEAWRSRPRTSRSLGVLVRRRADADASRAAADIREISRRFGLAFPELYASRSKPWRLDVVPLRDQLVGPVRPSLFLVAAAVGLLVLIAAANIANLLMLRAAARRRELAIRAALGASRMQIVRLLLFEMGFLAAGGATGGLAVALTGVRVARALSSSRLPLVADTHIDATSIAFLVALTLAVGFITAIAPALRHSSGDVRGELAGARGDEVSRGDEPLRNALVVAQVALALVVLIAAGLLARSFLALESVRLGFDSQGVLSTHLTIPRRKYDSTAKVVGFYRSLLTNVTALPGVASAAAVYPLPMSGDVWSGPLRVDGTARSGTDSSAHAEYALIEGPYFEAMGIPLLAGRDFAPTDTRETPRVAIVDEALARRYWPNESALGKRVGRGNAAQPWLTVVGVVAHVHNAGPRVDGEPQVYTPFAQSVQAVMDVVVRSDGSDHPTAATVVSIRSLIRRAEPTLPAAKIESMEAILAHALQRERLNVVLVGAFACTALVLAMVGLYGVIAALVARRTHEIGIRIALGGEPRAILAMVLRRGLVVTLVGLAIGVGLSLLGSRAIAGLLFGVAATDPVTYLLIAGGLAVVGVLATYGPASRATRVDPLVALRDGT